MKRQFKRDLTLEEIKKTSFDALYHRFILGETLNANEYETLLALAVCFLNADAVDVRRLGYRILVEYGNQTGDYAPLYEVAINQGLYPVSQFIENRYIADERRNFFTEWNAAFVERYASEFGYLTEEQRSLGHFFTEQKNATVAVVAPTSYGKSELILSAVKEYAGKNICVLTSTRALLGQTQKRIREVGKKYFSKIIVHPEMYNANDAPCLAVLTQERLLRLFKKDANLAFDCVVVDEAHELLENDGRNLTLAGVIAVAKKRNPNVAFKFLTPFIHEAKNLQSRHATYEVAPFKVSEYVKTEKYFLYDVRNRGGLQFYDQFLNDFIVAPDSPTLDSDEQVVVKYAAAKNIVYLNKPKDVENFALALAAALPDVASPTLDVAIQNIADYLSSEYHLLTCLRKGVVYHHGSVPDAVRSYVEKLYRDEAAIRYVVCSATLLSGVNLPAERMFILDNRRGTKNLTRASFKNLVGRVCRFNEIFNRETGTLQLLTPQIYLVIGQYVRSDANVKKFLEKTAQVQIKNECDDVKNVLLSHSDVRNNEKLQNALREAEEFLENYETGVVSNYDGRRAQTPVGKVCVANGVVELDVFACETKMQAFVDKHRNASPKINDADELINVLFQLFVQTPQEKVPKRWIPLNKEGARRFYAMLFDWRVERLSYSEMVERFVNYWLGELRKNYDKLIYVDKWGEVSLTENGPLNWVRVREKTREQLTNLAIVRVKEEQDYVDNTLIKLVEVLRELDLLDASFYNRVKYGTDDEETICLIKNGLSSSAARLLLQKYRAFLTLDVAESRVVCDVESLVAAMTAQKENQIVIDEVENCM
ncbi:MAG: DEAD/DEAH box helicase [Thermoguttaceae bacterium]|nr:DEAD/DEAH box helicase [Thermoguttaceae bacterium]